MILLRPYLAFAGGAALLSCAAWVWRIDSLRAAHLADLHECRVQKREQVSQFQRTQKSALDLATATKLRKDAEYDAARHKSDAALADLRQRYRTLVLRRAAHDRDPANGGALPPASRAAQSADRTGTGTGVPAGSFLISDADALICADNTARLQEARQWAISVAR